MLIKKVSGSNSYNGGIELDGNRLKIEQNYEQIDMKVEQSTYDLLKKNDISGFYPIILNVTPIENILPVLGISG
jgi:hypothetical protein